MSEPLVTVRATYWCDWWPPGDDEDAISWGGFCNPDNPWGTADDDVPDDPTCSECSEKLYWRHPYSGGVKVSGATGWLTYKPEWHEEPEPEDCEHRPEWANIEDDSEPIERTMNLYEAVRYIAAFPGGVWDLTESEPDSDFRTGVYTRVTLHVQDGPYAATALAMADMILNRKAA